MSLRVLTIVAILLLAPLVQSAGAHWLNSVERWVGIGASDGYHSRTGCPPKQPCAARNYSSGYPATWAVPEGPPIVPPATQSSAAPGYRAAPSLFRQPGSGPSAAPAGGSRYR